MIRTWVKTGKRGGDRALIGKIKIHGLTEGVEVG